MNMAHPALVRTLMEEAEVGRLESGEMEYWTDPVGNRKRKVTVRVWVLETVEMDEQKADGGTTGAAGGASSA